MKGADGSKTEVRESRLRGTTSEGHLDSSSYLSLLRGILVEFQSVPWVRE